MRIHHAHAMCSAVLCLPLFITLGRAPAAPVSDPPDDAPPQTAESDDLSTAETGGEIVLQIVYDNNPHDDRLQTQWGFGCVITGCEKTILFDTGGEGDVLLSNMRICGIDPSRIDAVVLSHIHGDHTGGLDEFLQVNPDVEVYLPKVFPDEFKAQVRKTAKKVIETDAPAAVCNGVCTTGVLGRRIHEQGISVETAEGILVITGCAHPGVVAIAEAAHEHTKKPVRLVLGGFHLVNSSTSHINVAVEGLKKLDAQQVAPCHCSGDTARAMMKKAFGDRYVGVGVGSRLTFAAKKKTPA